MSAIDRSRSIEDLEGIAWPAPALQSYVATASFALRRKPLGALTLEDMRIGMEQQIGLDYLVPLALGVLEDEPLAEARLYAGDLLQSLLDVPAEFWAGQPGERDRAARIADQALDHSDDLSPHWHAEMRPVLQQGRERLAGLRPSRPWLRPNAGKAPP